MWLESRRYNNLLYVNKDNCGCSVENVFGYLNMDMIKKAKSKETGKGAVEDFNNKELSSLLHVHCAISVSPCLSKHACYSPQSSYSSFITSGLFY